MRVLFMGTPEFAVPTLRALTTNHDVVAVVSQPDRPAGRGKKMTPPPVKVEALQYGIPVYQFEKINTEEAKATLLSLQFDVVVVVAYGQLLKPWLLDYPPLGCINVHASLLPRWRGASPINHAILAGDTISGVTTMLMAQGLDTGDMLMKKVVEIQPDMTAGDLHDQLSIEGAFLLEQTLEQIESKSLHPEVQDDRLATYAGMIDRAMAQIDWSAPGQKTLNQIRGFNPWPVAYTTYEGQRLKVYKASFQKTQAHYGPGTLIGTTKDAIQVQVPDGIISLLEIQAPNSKRMLASAYLIGHEMTVHTVLGE